MPGADHTLDLRREGMYLAQPLAQIDATASPRPTARADPYRSQAIALSPHEGLSTGCPPGHRHHIGLHRPPRELVTPGSPGCPVSYPAGGGIAGREYLCAIILRASNRIQAGVAEQAPGHQSRQRRSLRGAG